MRLAPRHGYAVSSLPWYNPFGRRIVVSGRASASPSSRRVWEGIEMKDIRIGSLSVSKVLCGTNAFFGRSHFSAARDAEYARRFDDEAIGRAIGHALSLGMNAVEGSASERMSEVLDGVRRTTGKDALFVGSTRIDETSPIRSHQQKLELLLAQRAPICVIHSQYVEPAASDTPPAGLERMVDAIHAAGLLAGVSVHRVGAVAACERSGYGIDAYLFPLNLSGFVYPGYAGQETPRERADLVRGTAKPFILMKALGAGRIPPDEGLHFVAESCKPTDALSIGFGSEAEMDETVRLVGKYF